MNTIVRLVFGDGDWESDENLGRGIVALLLLPFALIWHFLLFTIFSWTITRELRGFLFGIPAIATVACMLLALGIFSYYQDKVRNRYIGAFQESFSQGLEAKQDERPSDADLYFTDAKLFNVKSRSLDPSNAELQLQTAQLLVEENDGFEQAIPVLESIVALGENSESTAGESGLSAVPEGELDAHLLYAKVLLDSAIEFPKDELERTQLAEEHLRFVVKALEHEEYQVKLIRPSEMANLALGRQTLKVLSLFTESHVILSDLLFKNGEFEESIRYLKLAVSQAGTLRPDLFPRVLARIKSRIDELENTLEKEATQRQFDAEFTAAKTNLNRLVLSNPNDVRIWAAMLQCFQLKGDYDAARLQIESAKKMMTDLRALGNLRQLASDLFVSETRDFDYESIRGRPDLPVEKARFFKKLSSLTRAVEIAPTNMAAIKLLHELVLERDGQGPTEEHLDWMREFALLNDTRFVAFTVLGLNAAVRSLENNQSIEPDVIEDILLQWSHAETENKSALEAINLFAGIVYRDEDYQIGGDNKRSAKAIMNLALSFRANEPQFLQTRGTMYLLEEDYQSAYDDLHTAYELLVETRRVNPAILQALIDCTENLEDKQGEAEIYRERLDELREQIRQQRRVSA